MNAENTQAENTETMQHSGRNSTGMPTIKDTIIQLLSNLANPKEIEQYFNRFVNAGKTQFAVIKVGGAVLENDLENLCSSLAFLQQIGLYPIVVHGGGPQLSSKLKELSIASEFIDGQRVTSAEVLAVAKKIFLRQNFKLSSRLQAMGVKTASITSGVFFAEPVADKRLGLVGEVNRIELDSIEIAIKAGAIPILSSLGETSGGQSLNVNADVATNQLAIAIEPYKIIFLTETGGLLDEDGKIISSVNLVTDYSYLMEQPWLAGGMKLKVQQIADLLSRLPSTASVSMTTPAHLAKELFTHKGSGTLLRKGEKIMVHDNIESLKVNKLRQLLESSFRRKLDPDYFVKTPIYRAYVTHCYRAAAIVTMQNGQPYLDKFVVDEQAQGEGLGKAVWETMSDEIPSFFWRARPNNPINTFYYNKSDGFYKSENWFIFWRGMDDFKSIQSCVEYALNKTPTLK